MFWFESKMELIWKLGFSKQNLEFYWPRDIPKFQWCIEILTKYSPAMFIGFYCKDCDHSGRDSQIILQFCYTLYAYMGAKVLCDKKCVSLI